MHTAATFATTSPECCLIVNRFPRNTDSHHVETVRSSWFLHDLCFYHEIKSNTHGIRIQVCLAYMTAVFQ